MDILGILGILLGILTIILLIIKKFNIIIAAPIATIVVLLFNNASILDTVFGKEQFLYDGTCWVCCIKFRYILIRFNTREIHG